MTSMASHSVPADSLQASLVRIQAIILRHLYVMKGSPARLIEIIYWPTIQIVLWGFISKYMSGIATGAGYLAGYLIGAVMLWDMLFRTQIGVSVSVLEEFWSRNLGHLFVSPIRPWEWRVAMMVFAALRALMGITPAVIVAWIFYDYSIFNVGLPLGLFYFNLMMMGWWLGLFISALLMRVGQAAEGLAWAFTFMLMPVSAAIYPVATLPGWLQTVAFSLPAAHVFEGMRKLMQGGGLDGYHLAMAFGLNILYITLAFWVLQGAHKACRRAGSFLQAGE